ncbi:MAG: hypothetical protein KC457_24735, partial [Myxococcales bacterium]|nr:hypothetical protein [Myxococcales bacterium]
MAAILGAPGLGTPSLRRRAAPALLLILLAVLLAPLRGRAAPPGDGDDEEAAPAGEDGEVQPPEDGTREDASPEDGPPPDGPPPDGPPPDGPPPDGPPPDGPPDGPPRGTPGDRQDRRDDAGGTVADCEPANRADPFYPVLVALEALEAGRIELRECRQITQGRRGTRLIEGTLAGRDQDLLLYRLEILAADGFEVFLSPTDADEVLFGVRPAIAGGSVQYIGVDTIELVGDFVAGDDQKRIETILGLRSGNFYPFEIAARLGELGYRASFVPQGPKQLRIEVRPGRSIRRVRLRGQIPLAKRDVLRQLSLAAQPGALARGECIEPKVLRQGDPPPICDARDLACLEWERDEVARIDQFLFDSGYLDGSTSLALVCGRSPSDADLYILLDKGKPYKIDRNAVDVVDADADQVGTTGETIDERDSRWIRRQFIPRVLGVFRTRVTREFMDKAVEKVERAYAEPNAGLGRFWQAQDAKPHPEVEVTTSYDAIKRDSKLPGQNLPLEVAIARGPAVQTEFKPVRSEARKRRRDSGLSFSDSQLRAQIQLFNRREPSTPSAARRESANLRAYYQSKGYLFAQVRGEHLDFKTLDKLRFEIIEGPKVTIADLELVRPARLVPAVAKRIEKSWNDERALRRGGSFSESDALADIQAVTAAYNNEGYLCARVVIELAFWREGLDQGEGTRAILDVQSLLDSGGEPAWLQQFDADGLAGILAADRAEVWVRVRVDPGPRVLTAAGEEIRYLEQEIPPTRKVDDLIVRDPATQEVAWGAPRMLGEGPLRRRNEVDPGGVPVTLVLEREARNSIVQRY